MNFLFSCSCVVALADKTSRAEKTPMGCHGRHFNPKSDWFEMWGNRFRDMKPNHLGASMTSQRIKATAHTARWDGCQLLSFLLHLHMKRKRKSRPAEEYHIQRKYQAYHYAKYDANARDFKADVPNLLVAQGHFNTSHKTGR